MRPRWAFALLLLPTAGCLLVFRCEFDGTCRDERRGEEPFPGDDCIAILTSQSEVFVVGHRLADFDRTRREELGSPGGWLQLTPTGADNTWIGQREGAFLYKDVPTRCNFLAEIRVRLGRSDGAGSSFSDAVWNLAGLLLRNPASALGSGSWIQYDLGVHDLFVEFGCGLTVIRSSTFSRYVSVLAAGSELRLCACRIGPDISFFYQELGGGWSSEPKGRLIAGDGDTLPDQVLPIRATRPDLVEDNTVQLDLTVGTGYLPQAIGTFEYLCIRPMSNQTDYTTAPTRPCDLPP